MRTALWVAFFISVTVFASWVVLGQWQPKNYVVIYAIAALFAASSFGALWVWYRAVRYEAHPIKFVLLALIPYFFLWYYFERVRREKANHF